MNNVDTWWNRFALIQFQIKWQKLCIYRLCHLRPHCRPCYYITITILPETVSVETKSVSALNKFDTLYCMVCISIPSELPQLLVTPFSCAPNLFIFTVSTPNHVALGTISLLACCLYMSNKISRMRNAHQKRQSHLFTRKSFWVHEFMQ